MLQLLNSIQNIRSFFRVRKDSFLRTQKEHMLDFLTLKAIGKKPRAYTQSPYNLLETLEFVKKHGL